MHASRERHLSSMTTSGHHHYERGVWTYGDYKNDVDADTPLKCATECENDEGCWHWNFHVVHHKCHLKSDSSGHDEGAPDWISGNSKRWISTQPKKESSS